MTPLVWRKKNPAISPRLLSYSTVILAFHHCTGSQQGASRGRVLAFYRIAPCLTGITSVGGLIWGIHSYLDNLLYEILWQYLPAYRLIFVHVSKLILIWKVLYQGRFETKTQGKLWNGLFLALSRQWSQDNDFLFSSRLVKVIIAILNNWNHLKFPPAVERRNELTILSSWK